MQRQVPVGRQWACGFLAELVAVVDVLAAADERCPDPGFAPGPGTFTCSPTTATTPTPAAATTPAYGYSHGYGYGYGYG
ncbi:hypothetical protein [Streptomyces lydicus]|uniref:hypothetical protein n=1 Tax=Streptomyces lydicus TaxID=47763 RepID=UPI000F8E9C1C|nr:hypothetical protein [Streptomyces lydicus]